METKNMYLVIAVQGHFYTTSVFVTPAQKNQSKDH